VTRYGLLAAGLERGEALIMSIGVALALNALLIPRYGTEGAAIAFLVSDTLADLVGDLGGETPPGAPIIALVLPVGEPA
jgi:hypothetical protein